MRQKNGKGTGGQQSSGKHRTLIAAHQRDASDPRRPITQLTPAYPHDDPYDARHDEHSAARYAEDDDRGWNELQPRDWDDEGWDGAGDWDQAETERSGAYAPRGRPADSVIYDRETGLVPTHLPTLGDSAPLAPVPSQRGRVKALRRVTRAAMTGALVITGLRPKDSVATVIPGKARVKVRMPVLPGKRLRESRFARPAILAATCVALLSALVLTGVANQDGLIGPLAQGIWASRGSVHALPTPIGGWWDAPIASDAPAAPSSTDPAHFVNKYGFDWPSLKGGLWQGERPRLQAMLPFALAATARWDARYGDSLEPQMLLFWTHAEGISGRVNYSNCANESAPSGSSWFTYISNCDTPSFWQLGYGNQFSVISILKTAFTDMRGDPNDPRVVQQVGQAVLNWDRAQGTTPACGGFSCTFPAITIDQLMAGVSLSHMTINDWWASVLSRDPAINCYMLARALVWFSHNATRNWVGCYYAEPCWTYESDRLGDILASWDSLRKGAGV